MSPLQVEAIVDGANVEEVDIEDETVENMAAAVDDDIVTLECMAVVAVVDIVMSENKTAAVDIVMGGVDMAVADGKIVDDCISSGWSCDRVEIYAEVAASSSHDLHRTADPRLEI